jgi:hypothetical protein
MSGNQVLPHRPMGCRPSWVSRLGMCRRCHRGRTGPREGIGERIIVVRDGRRRHREQHRGIDCREAEVPKPQLRSVQAQIPTLGPEFRPWEALHPAGRRPAHAPHLLPSTRRGVSPRARETAKRIRDARIRPFGRAAVKPGNGPPGFGRSRHARCRIALESGL